MLCILELTYIHLLENKLWTFFSVLVTHLFDNGVREVDVSNLFIFCFFILKHLLTETRVATANVQDLIIRTDEFIYYWFKRTVALIPVKLFVFISLISLLPVLLPSVLSHFSCYLLFIICVNNSDHLNNSKILYH